ncbi:MAG: hypothetical protein J7623_07030 [Chitinophaga sp.]|uniref:hypothetical protein n=1 Tax=Chitinophaga sp. TaxID=1869181 RepID=UPI001B28370D|nr:hypothetical protein [Chitinophaga sp.]MBO9728377.1 hypothetical protein [Chitinophaga sp.]
MKTMRKHLLLPVALLTLAACHESKVTEEHTATAAAPPSDIPADAEKISQPCAILYAPDSARLEKLKKENGEEAFYTMADDNQNYLADARMFLEGKGVKIMAPNGGKLHFESKSGHTTTIDLSDPKYNWEAWLYDGNKVNKIDLTNIENEYLKYMKK